MPSAAMSAKSCSASGCTAGSAGSRRKYSPSWLMLTPRSVTRAPLASTICGPAGPLRTDRGDGAPASADEGCAMAAIAAAAGGAGASYSMPSAARKATTPAMRSAPSVRREHARCRVPATTALAPATTATTSANDAASTARTNSVGIHHESGCAAWARSDGSRASAWTSSSPATAPTPAVAPAAKVARASSSGASARRRARPRRSRAASTARASAARPAPLAGVGARSGAPASRVKPSGPPCHQCAASHGPSSATASAARPVPRRSRVATSGGGRAETTPAGSRRPTLASSAGNQPTSAIFSAAYPLLQSTKPQVGPQPIAYTPRQARGSSTHSVCSTAPMPAARVASAQPPKNMRDRENAAPEALQSAPTWTIARIAGTCTT